MIMKPIYKKEFERRVEFLVQEWERYKKTGKESNVLPAIFKINAFIYCNNPKLNSHGKK